MTSPDIAATSDRSRTGITRRLLSAVIAAAVLAGLYLTTFHSYLLFHALAEGFSITVGFAIFILAWNSRRFTQSSYLLFLGIAYLYVSGIDLVHTLGYKGMGVLAGASGNLAAQLWIAARSVEAVSLLIAPLLVGRRLKANAIFNAYAIVFVLVLGSIFAWDVFPLCFVEGVGLTPFKKISEYVISAILLGSVGTLLLNRRSFDPGVLRLLVTSILLTIASEFAFTLYTDVYGHLNLIGHYLKIISFYCIYVAVVQIGLRDPYSLLFRDLRQSQQALQAERDFVSAVLSSAGGLVLVLDREGRIVRFNRACERAAGYTFEEVRGRPIWDVVIAQDERAFVRAEFDDLQSDSLPNESEGDWVARDGSRRRIAWWNTALLDSNGDVSHLIATGVDVTERRRAEQQLQQALAEKEVLLAETHHRVRNNLQIIASLLDLSHKRAGSSEAANLLRDARDRVFTMGLIHTDLYGGQRFDEVDMGLHVRHLAERLANVYHTEDTNVSLSISAPDVRLTLAQAVPCGLILNELMTNAYQHAFAGRQSGTIEVTLEELPDRAVLLRVKDDGIGMPGDVDIHDPQTIGLQLMRGLADQIEGKVDLVPGVGTEIAVRFKLDSSRPDT